MIITTMLIEITIIITISLFSHHLPFTIATITITINFMTTGNPIFKSKYQQDICNYYGLSSTIHDIIKAGYTHRNIESIKKNSQFVTDVKF